MHQLANVAAERIHGYDVGVQVLDREGGDVLNYLGLDLRDDCWLRTPRN